MFKYIKKAFILELFKSYYLLLFFLPIIYFTNHVSIDLHIMLISLHFSGLQTVDHKKYYRAKISIKHFVMNLLD